MLASRLWVAAVATALLASSAAHSQNSQPSPEIKNVNPATSPSTDDDGNNPLARAGENSPTGQGPSVPTNPPVAGTVGSGPGNAGPLPAPQNGAKIEQ